MSFIPEIGTELVHEYKVPWKGNTRSCWFHRLLVPDSTLDTTELKGLEDAYDI